MSEATAAERIEVEPVPVDSELLAVRALSRVDYADAFRARVPGEVPLDVDALARRMFAAVPGWVTRLLRVRDGLVRGLGLKTTPAGAAPPDPRAFVFEPGRELGLFRVYARTAREILLGQDDRHLDFRVSIRLDEGEAGAARFATLATTVCFHNALGRAYFLPVKPIHKRIVASWLRHALQPGAATTAREPTP